MLGGWGAYFRKGNASRQVRQLDEFVRERPALFLSKEAGRHGRGWQRPGQHRSEVTALHRSTHELQGLVFGVKLRDEIRDLRPARLAVLGRLDRRGPLSGILVGVVS